MLLPHKPPRRRERSLEYLSEIYHAPDWHLAARHCLASGGAGCMASATSGRAATSGFSDYPGFGKFARGSAQYNGVHRGAASGTSVFANSRVGTADFNEHLG